jgi:hypothetical protein
LGQQAKFKAEIAEYKNHQEQEDSKIQKDKKSDKKKDAVFKHSLKRIQK